MRALWSIISVIAVAHLLALIALIGWMAGSDRLNRDRVEAIRDIFLVSITDEQASLEEAAKAGESAEAQDSIADSTSDDVNVAPSDASANRVNRLRTVDELLREREQRFEKDRRHLMATLNQEYKKLEKGWEELRANETKFNERLERIRSLSADEQFQKMVGILKGLSGKDLKGKFDAYLEAGETDLVVDILDAFDKRTAQKVIKEYTTEADNALAADLLIRLKDRGLTLDTP